MTIYHIAVVSRGNGYELVSDTDLESLNDRLTLGASVGLEVEYKGRADSADLADMRKIVDSVKRIQDGIFPINLLEELVCQ